MKHDPAIHSPKFPASVKPARPGVYYRVADDGLYPNAFSLFSGSAWHFGDDSADKAASWTGEVFRSYSQSIGFHWFGLKEKTE